MASMEWSHVSSPAGGARRTSVASSSASLASANPMLTAVYGSQLDSSRRAREKHLNSQLLAQISQSPFARASTTGSLSALSSPTLLNHLTASKISSGSPRLGTLGLTGTVRTPRSTDGTPLSVAASPRGTRLLLRAQHLPGQSVSDGSTYLSYLVTDRKKRPGEVPDEHLDVDLDELAAQAARDQEAAKGQTLADPPAFAAPKPRVESVNPTESNVPEPSVAPISDETQTQASADLPAPTAAVLDSGSRLVAEHVSFEGLGASRVRAAASESGQLVLEPSAKLLTSTTPVVSPADPAGPVHDSALLGSKRVIEHTSLTELGSDRLHAAAPQSASPVASHSATGDYNKSQIFDQVVKPTYLRSAARRSISTSPPPRTSSPTEVDQDEFGGEWRKRLEDDTFESTLEDDDETSVSNGEEERKARDKENRLEKLRGGPPRASSRDPNGDKSARRAARTDRSVSSEQAEATGPADVLLRRIERHFDSNGDGELDAAELSTMFDALDRGGTGRLTQQDLRAGLQKAQILSPGGAEQVSHTPTSEEAQQFRSDWRESAHSIEQTMPAQYNAIRQGIDIDEDAAPLRPSLAHMSSKGLRMVEAVEEQNKIAKQVKVRKGRLQLGKSEPPAVAGEPPVSPVERTVESPSRGLSLTISTSSAVRTSSGTSPRTVADEVRAGNRNQHSLYAQQREQQRVAEEREEADRLATRRANRSTLDSLLS